MASPVVCQQCSVVGDLNARFCWVCGTDYLDVFEEKEMMKE